MSLALPRFIPAGNCGRQRCRNPWLIPLLLGIAFAQAPAWADDDYIPRPFDPGIGFEGLLPRPPLPPYLVLDQHTTPMGIRQVFNTPQTIMGQSFTPKQPFIDWIAFVFQNRTQPGNLPAPGRLRVRLYASLDTRTSVLSDLLAESDTVAIPVDTTAWLIFSFPDSVPVTPGTRIFCRIEWLDGHPTWVGGRLHDFYPAGGAFGYLPNPFGGPIQNLNWHLYDLVFAQGTGRPPSGVPPGEFLQWALTRGLDTFDETADLDGDGRSALIEYLRDTDPLSSKDPARSRAHLIELDGAHHLAWTFAAPVRLEYLHRADGSVAAGTGHAVDALVPIPHLAAPASQGARLVEVVPALADTLPPLSPFHRYRTFRFEHPISRAPHGFILHRVQRTEPGQ
ncbi:MAG: hypothetical protein KF833_19880 [Verrucomicrobiae bacterium]|nr:hypothetical protein [Verrucomicrobiae bacterium]